MLWTTLAVQGAFAQEIRLYSEFERIDPWGIPIASDRDLNPREILSPAVPRNGHLSLHITITAPASGNAGFNYFLYVESNPPNILQLTLYREHWVRFGKNTFCDWLSRMPSPTFGAIPESLTEYEGQTTRNYLLDIYVPPDVPPRRVRVEALLKVGIWLVAPLEVRVIEPVVPETRSIPQREMIAALDAQSSTTAQLQFLRFQSGLPPVLPLSLLRGRDFIQRNAAEDMWLARSYGVHFPELNWMSFWPFTYPELGAEWYLKVRDFLYRFDP